MTDRKIRNAINNLLQLLNTHPILIDVGASGNPPEIWEDIKHNSRYVGFDPDPRDIPDCSSLGYWKSDIIDKAVISENDRLVDIFLTKSPYCSSTLSPDLNYLEHYAWHNLFIIQEKTAISAITLSELISNIGLDRIDWFKTDSQGIDLRLFLSIPEVIRDKILAVDIEPGLMPAYIGEDYFTSAHESLISQGFWLSDIKIGSCPRIHQHSINNIFSSEKKNAWKHCMDALPGSPYYCEARYFRSIEWLKSHNAGEREYIFLCIFALIDGKIGYAIDIINAFHEITSDPILNPLEDILCKKIRKKIMFQEMYSEILLQAKKIIQIWR